MLLVDRPGLKQSTVALGEPGVGLKDPDAPALDVLTSVLNNFGGRLFNQIRSREVCQCFDVGSPSCQTSSLMCQQVPRLAAECSRFVPAAGMMQVTKRHASRFRACLHAPLVPVSPSVQHVSTCHRAWHTMSAAAASPCPSTMWGCTCWRKIPSTDIANYTCKLLQGLAYSVSGGWNTTPFDHVGLFTAGGETAAPAKLLRALRTALEVAVQISGL